MNKQRTKVVSEIETETNDLSVKAPFRIRKDDKRRYIRLEISKPMKYCLLKNRTEGFWPNGNGPSYQGIVLNVSAGGVLILGKEPIEEGTLVVMSMTLQDVEVIDNVIGVAKRVESEGNEWLIGFEFIPREYLVDYLSTAQYDVVSRNVSSFDECLRAILNKYVYHERVSKEAK